VSITSFLAVLALVVCPRAAGALEAPVVPDLPEDPALGAEASAEPNAEPGMGPSLRLGDAVALALKQNFGLQATVDSVEVARLGESTARAQFFPKLTPSWQRSLGTTSNTETRTLSLAGTQRVPWLGTTVTASGALNSVVPSVQADLLTPSLVAPRSADFRLNIAQPLLRGFGPTATMFDLTSKHRAREGQERSLTLARQLLAEQVTDAFYGVVRQRQLLAVARQSLTRNEELLRASEARMQAGLASKLDVLRADLQVSLAQDALLAGETLLQAALESFRVLLGLHATDAIEPEDVHLREDPTLDLAPTDVLVARAIENRLDLLETRDRVSDARRAATVAKQNLLPQLDLNVQLTRFGIGSTFSQSLHSLDQRVDVFLSTSYPLERSDDRAQRAEALLTLSASERSLTQRKLEIEAEVRSAVRDLGRVAKSIELQKKSVALAEQKHRLATIRYQRGLDSNFNVVEAEGELVTSRASLVSLLTQLEVGRVRLLRLTGELDVEREFAR
jgi:outer membrane protein